MAAQESKPQTAKTIPHFKPGDTLRVHLKVVEGDSERTQVFEGIVITRRGRGVSESFTVRKISFGVGVERIFPIQSPRIQKIELVRSGKVRRARLYYLRGLTGKAARLSEDTREGKAQADSKEPSSQPPSGGLQAAASDGAAPAVSPAAAGAPSAAAG